MVWYIEKKEQRVVWQEVAKSGEFAAIDAITLVG